LELLKLILFFLNVIASFINKYQQTESRFSCRSPQYWNVTVTSVP
jgi:hypothetical protein